MVFFDFIEIGTSNFDTEIQKATDETIGLSIEPLKNYLDDLPEKKKCIKYNCAVSDYKGTIDVFFMKEEMMVKCGLPDWARGCNSVNRPHPTVVKELTRKNIEWEKAIETEKVPVFRLSDLLRKFNVSGIYFLKIDTEGHDCVILNDYLNYCLEFPSFLAHQIMFESNSLSKREEVDHIIDRLISMGYDIIHRGADTKLSLNITTGLNKSNMAKLFTSVMENYYIEQYPNGFDPNSLPYGNTLEEAMKWCFLHNCAGITFKYGRYEVRRGPRLNLKPVEKEAEVIRSWIRL